MCLSDTIAEIRPSITRVDIKIQGHYRPMGSGFFISEEGHVATCHHVINSQGGTTPPIRVVNDDGISEQGTVIETDSARDLAIIETNHQSTTQSFGNYEETRIGDEIIIPGYPLSFGYFTTHEGIISAKFHDPSGDVNIHQLDATINYGNSGGPLVLKRSKELIGMIDTKRVPFFNQIEAFIQYSGTFPKIKRGVSIMGVDIGSLVNFTVDKFNLLSRAFVTGQVGIGYAISINDLEEILSKYR